MNRFIYRLAAAAAALALAVIFVSNVRIQRQSAAPLDSVVTAVTQVVDMNGVQPGDNNMIKRLYKIDPNEYEGCALYYPKTNMHSQELLIVKLGENSDMKKLVDAANARLDTQKKSFDGYGEAQFDMLVNNSAVIESGNYFMFVVDSNSAAAVEAFDRALREG